MSMHAANILNEVPHLNDGLMNGERWLVLNLKTGEVSTFNTQTLAGDYISKLNGVSVLVCVFKVDGWKLSEYAFTAAERTRSWHAVCKLAGLSEGWKE